MLANEMDFGREGFDLTATRKILAERRQVVRGLKEKFDRAIDESVELLKNNKNSFIGNTNEWFRE